jgi:hypothetical protein
MQQCSRAGHFRGEPRGTPSTWEWHLKGRRRPQIRNSGIALRSLPRLGFVLIYSSGSIPKPFSCSVLRNSAINRSQRAPVPRQCKGCTTSQLQLLRLGLPDEPSPVVPLSRAFREPAVQSKPAGLAKGPLDVCQAVQAAKKAGPKHPAYVPCGAACAA